MVNANSLSSAKKNAQLKSVCPLHFAAFKVQQIWGNFAGSVAQGRRGGRFPGWVREIASFLWIMPPRGDACRRLWVQRTACRSSSLCLSEVVLCCAVRRGQRTVGDAATTPAVATGACPPASLLMSLSSSIGTTPDGTAARSPRAEKGGRPLALQVLKPAPLIVRTVSVAAVCFPFPLRTGRGHSG
jgi:hypothetical protein